MQLGVDDSQTKPLSEETSNVRLVMKQMVKHAVLSAPIQRTVSLTELVRTQHVLYKVAVDAIAKTQFNIGEKQGMGDNILSSS